MLKFYEEKMPKEISPVRRETGVMHVRWMVERRMQENEEMVKEEAMRNGTRRGALREGSGPNERFDCGMHMKRTCREVLVTVIGR